jgi:outer membrane receptor protein involved in Fe transport
VKLVICSALLVILAAATGAQTVIGTVLDNRDAAVPDADVSIERNGRLVSRTRSDGSGNFSLAAGGGGVLRVAAAGFAAFEGPVSGLSSPTVVVLQPATVSESVIVSITGTETRLDETPASVVVLDRAVLDSSAAQTLDDALRQIAGFTLFRRSSSKTANPTTQGANLRGIGGSGASRTSVQFDGVSLNDAFGGWTYWSRVPRIAVDRVEVLRGGASSIYGSSALSGAINLLSRRDERRALRLEASAGSQKTLDGGIYGAYGWRDWFADIAVESFQTGGYIPVPPEERGAVDTPANGRHSSGLITLERGFGENIRAFARGALLSERRDNGTSLTNNRTYFRQAVLGTDAATEKYGTFQVRAVMDAQVYDQTFSAVSADRNSENLTRVQRVPSRSVLGSIFWTRVFDRHTLSARTEVRLVRGFSGEVAVAGNSATALVSAGGEELRIGLFVQDSWRVTPRLTLDLSARFDTWREFDGASRSRNLVTNQLDVRNFPARSESNLSPRFAAIYRVTDSVSIFGCYARSFRAPSLNELYRPFRVGNVLTLANEQLTAETARTVEGGVRYDGFSRRLTLRGNLFRTEVSDPVVSVTLTSTPSLITRQRQNVGRTRTIGVELDVEFKVTGRLGLNASYLQADSRVVESPGNPELTGNFVPQISRRQLTFQASYRPTRRSTVSIQGRSADAQYDDDLNLLRLRPYFTLDAFAGHRITKRTEIFAAAENLFGSRYDIGLTPGRTIAAPRSFRLGIRFDLMRND